MAKTVHNQTIFFPASRLIFSLVVAVVAAAGRTPQAAAPEEMGFRAVVAVAVAPGSLAAAVVAVALVAVAVVVAGRTTKAAGPEPAERAVSGLAVVAVPELIQAPAMAAMAVGMPMVNSN